MALYPLVRPKFIADNSVLASGYQLFFYEVGTTTKQNTYTDATLATPNPNPVILNARGEPDNAGTPIDIFWLPGATYKVVLATDTDTDPPASPVWTVPVVTDLAGLAQHWTNPTAATRASATTFTISGVDKTSQFHVNRRVKLTGGADRYGRITDSTFAVDTTVTLSEITDNSGASVSLHASMGFAYVSIMAADATSANDVLYPINQDELNAGVIPVSLQYKHQSVFRFMSVAEIADAKLASPTLDHSAALLEAYTAIPDGGTLWFDDAIYMWDFQLVIAKSIHFRGSGGAEVKLPDQSTLFHLGDATRRPYMIYVQESDVSFSGIKFNGNSVTNFKDVGGTDQYNYTAGPIYSCGIIQIGFGGFHATGAKDLDNISIKDCEFIDSPHTGVDMLNVGFEITNYRNTNNHYLKCQGDQCSIGNCRSGVVSHNTHEQPYNHGIHVYQNGDNIAIHDNTIFFDSTLLTSSIVQYFLDTGTWVAFGIKLGKNKTTPVSNINCHDNTLKGCGIDLVQGLDESNVHHNNVTGAQDASVGINYQNSSSDLGDATTQYDVTNPSGDIVRYTYDGTGADPGITATNPPPGARIFTSGGTLSAANSGYFDVHVSGADYIEVVNPTNTPEVNKTTTIKWSIGRGNTINNNIVTDCYNPGIYLADTLHEVYTKDNILIGNNTSTAQFGSRDIFANLCVISPNHVVERNTIKRKAEAPTYGINVFTGTSVTGRVNDGSAARQLLHFNDNDVHDGGFTTDFYDVDGNARNIQVTPRGTYTTDKNFSLRGHTGDTKAFTYQNDSIADDGSVNLPDSTSGMAFVSCNAEAGYWLVQNDGTCTKISGTTNTADTNTDTNLCVYDTGTQARVVNRLGVVGEIRVIYYYN